MVKLQLKSYQLGIQKIVIAQEKQIEIEKHSNCKCSLCTYLRDPTINLTKKQKLK